MPNFYAVIREAMRKSGFQENEIDYLAILHFNAERALCCAQRVRAQGGPVDLS